MANLLPEPAPPGQHFKTAGHHWLEVKDSDGHSFGIVVMQWNPGAKRWSSSGNVGTGIYRDTSGWMYVGRCPEPGSEEDSIGWRLKNSPRLPIEEAPRDGTYFHALRGDEIHYVNWPQGFALAYWTIIEGSWRGCAMPNTASIKEWVR